MDKFELLLVTKFYVYEQLLLIPFKSDNRSWDFPVILFDVSVFHNFGNTFHKANYSVKTTFSLYRTIVP